jgi:hypothetical protein
MENNYWIVDDWLIFKPEFNDKLDEYYDIINKYNKIIFSNYDDPLIAIKNNNCYNDEYCDNYIYSIFNNEIDLSNNINLTYLAFGSKFNKKIDLLNNINLTHLIFEEDFNQEIDLSNNINLTHLAFGWNFNKKIDLSNNINLTHLTHLTFGFDFNQEIDLSNNINLKDICLYNYNYLLDLSNHLNLECFALGSFNNDLYLPNNDILKTLTFGVNFKKPIIIPLSVNKISLCSDNQYLIDNLHNNIKELILSVKKFYFYSYNKELNNLPNSIEYLEFDCYHFKIKKLPKNLKTIKCNKNYPYIDDFKNYELITF